MNIDEIRSRIPGLKHCSYLNMSYGPKPTPVTDEVVRMARYIEEYGTLSKEVMEEIERVYEGARVDVARLLGASTDEIALTRHVSEGINIVATGIDWEPGDEVIVTDEEHPCRIAAVDEPHEAPGHRRASSCRLRRTRPTESSSGWTTSSRRAPSCSA